MPTYSRAWLLVLPSVFTLAVPNAQAEDVALLVGIGKYQLRNADLPGIEHDIEAMKEFAVTAGFDSSNIIVLTDQQATLSGFRLAFQMKLLSRVSESDRVLIYFSGHGTQVPDRNGDEEDKSDEALMMHDTRKRYREGKVELVNVLIDDEIEDMLAAIATEDVLVLIDACHSGTVTKVLDLEGLEDDDGFVFKSYIYEGMPETTESFARSLITPDPAEFNYVALTAAGDDERAIATKSGSVFTKALHEVVSDAASRGETLTIEGLQASVTTRVWAAVKPEKKFTPRISGNISRASQIAVVKSD